MVKFLMVSLACCCLPMTLSALSDQQLSDQLGWITELNNPHNICNGYYNELPIFYTPSNLVKSQKDNYDFSADHVSYSLKGDSTAVGHVKVTQKDSQMTAQKAILFRSQQDGQASQITLKGDVRLREPGRLVVAHRADMNLKTKVKTLYNIFYRFSLGDTNPLKQTEQQTTTKQTTKQTTKVKAARDYNLNARGQADSFTQESPTYAVLKGATYTTCPPVSNTWKVKASRINLDKDSGRGTAWNTRFLLHGFPVFYLPYFNFPIDSRRKSGFLWPSFGYSSDDGFSFALPLYLNFAPNYDATITPRIIQRRGTLWNGVFRYLTPFDSGQFVLGYIHQDREFKNYQDKSRTRYSGNPALNRLLNSNDDRRAFSWRDHATWTKQLTTDVNYNYVSDDYYKQDFDTNIMDVSEDQLPRQARVNYASDNWNFLANWQAYQTLHRLDGSASDQYSRLPQLQWNADYPDELGGLDYSVNTEFDRFVKVDELSGPRPVQGDRVSAAPKISWPIAWPFAYITPEAKLEMIKYKVWQQAGGNPNEPGLAIPMFDVKSGLYFDRSTAVFGHDYRQTLEPMLYYLYVPYRNQDRLPIFDTVLQTFSYDVMYQDDRFSGWDRVGDANQVTYGVVSRFIDNYTGAEKASFSIGQIHYFRDRQVDYYSGQNPKPISTTNRRVVSPVAAAANYNLTSHWIATATAAWSDHSSRFNNDTLGMTYQLDPSRLISASYDYVRGGDTLPGAASNAVKHDLKQTTISTMWRLNDHWSVMGGFNYNWTHRHTQAYFYGLSYDACSWAIRAIGGQTFIGDSPNNINRAYDDYTYEHKNVFYLQFVLKGLGDFGGATTQSYLESNIKNYVDRFGQVGNSNV